MTRAVIAALAGPFTASAAVVFLLTAAVGVMAAYNRVEAFDRFALLAAAFVLLAPLSWLSVRDVEAWVPGMLALAAALAGGLLGIYFLLDYDWNSQEIQFAPIRQLGREVERLRPDVALPDPVNPNVAAGALIVLIFVGLGGLAWLMRRRPVAFRWMLGIPAGLGLAMASFALVMTDSRGAWLSIATGLPVFLYALWRSGPGRRSALRTVGDVAAALAAVTLLAAIALMLVDPARAGEWIHAVAGSSALGRAQLWHDAAAMIDDYRFTGSGLSSTMMIYSTYYLLLHVGYITHMHNLALQIAVEQGVPGLAAFLCLTVGTATLLMLVLTEGTPGRRRLAAGALAALVAILAHGLLDAGLYASRLAPLLFLPLLIAWPMRPRRREDDPVSWERLAFLGAALPPALAVVVFVLPGSRAAFQANLGALEQSVGELSVYEWPAWPLQDELRRTGAVDLTSAQGRYTAALMLDPGNGTAHARLGQIALAQGDLDAARTHLETAYAVAPDRRAVRQLLGEVYALQGDPASAVALWQGLDLSAGQLALRQWWVHHAGTPEQAQRIDTAISALRGGQ